MPTIIIPYAGTFAVYIKDSSGTIVYGPTFQLGLTPFDPSISAEGEYILTVDNDGAETSFCFKVTGCDCPPLLYTNLEFIGVTYYFDLFFNYSSGFGCPFKIYIQTDYTYGYININSLSDLEFVSGTVYKRRIMIGGFGHVIWRVEQTDGTVCFDGENDGVCKGINLTIASTSGEDPTIDVSVLDCGDCESITVNWAQTFPSGSGITGTLPYSVNCAGLPDTLNISVSPSFGSADFAVFSVSVIDCCGTTYTKTVTFTKPACEGPLAYPVGGVALATFTLASGPVIAFDFKASSPFTCAGYDCSSITVSYTQVNAGIVGLPDSGTINIPNVCSSIYVTGGTVKIPISPNTSYPAYTGGSVVAGSGRALYAVTVTNCCEQIVSGNTP